MHDLILSEVLWQSCYFLKAVLNSQQPLREVLADGVGIVETHLEKAAD